MCALRFTGLVITVMPQRGMWFWRLTHWDETAESNGRDGLGHQGLCAVTSVADLAVVAASGEQWGALPCRSKWPSPPSRVLEVSSPKQ